ncbi:hypothetical protein COO60DRAFT_419456 [Scenedesmus sp. NREL 46B-D3]|nr:hypothetical protein COO60DRAFT_419456 [Scenedesmus sp. NREL 46B-D3]
MALTAVSMQCSNIRLVQHSTFVPCTHRHHAIPAIRPGSSHRRATTVRASSDNPARQVLSGLVSSIYKATSSFQEVDASLPPLWRGLKKLDQSAVQAALRDGADPNTTNAAGDTPLLYIAREGHYKYPPAEIPALLIQSGANLEAKDSTGKTALQVALLSGWQNIAELLLKSGASTTTVTADTKSAITCPDCKRIVATYNL